MAAEIGNWPIEPTTLFMFSYYPTNGLEEEATYNSNLLQDYNACLQAAKDYITTQANVGVAVIQPITCSIVYPFKEWVAF